MGRWSYVAKMWWCSSCICAIPQKEVKGEGGRDPSAFALLKWSGPLCSSLFYSPASFLSLLPPSSPLPWLEKPRTITSKEETRQRDLKKCRGRKARAALGLGVWDTAVNPDNTTGQRKQKKVSSSLLTPPLQLGGTRRGEDQTTDKPNSLLD